MRPVPTTQVSIIAVGVESYQFMPRLSGPKSDVDRFVHLLSECQSTSLYNQAQVFSMINPDSNTLRACVNNYLINRSAQGDILIFYFSGHGIPIGSFDFGFCTTDSRTHDNTGSVLPFTVIRFRDLLDSLRVMNVTPFVIIDACYSGQVGSALNLSPSDAIHNMQSEITKQNATNYALFCSCSDRQVSSGNANGGYFSQVIFTILSEGYTTKNSDESVIYIKYIYEETIRRAASIFTEAIPQLFLGDTMPSVPLVKNIGFTPKQERFSPYMGRIVLELWNNGNEQELSREEILSIVGPGAYANHSKLDDIWSLVEENPNSHKIRLTERGRQFVKGEITIPNIMVLASNKNYVVSPKARYLNIQEIVKGNHKKSPGNS